MQAEAHPILQVPQRVLAEVMAFLRYMATIPWNFFDLSRRMINWAVYYDIQSGDNPPGPMINLLPIFGSVPLLINDSYLMLTRMAVMFGNVYQLKMGGKNVVVISDSTLLKRAFRNKNFAGRRLCPTMDITSRDGILNDEGHRARCQRAQLSSTLDKWRKHTRTCNFKTLSDRARDVVIPRLLHEVGLFNGRPFFIEAEIDFAIINLVFSSFVGTEFDHDDPHLLRLIKATHEIHRANGLLTFENCVPLISYSYAAWSNRKKIEAWRVDFRNFVQPIIETHRQRLDPENPRDIIDEYLIKINRAEEHFDQPRLYAILEDFFSHGLATTSAAIQWLLLLIVKNRAIGKRVFAELSILVRANELPLMAMVDSVPYLKATILDALRLASIHPVGIPHRTVANTIVGGYHIPADSTIIGLFWKIHRVNEPWSYPNRLYPGHHFKVPPGRADHALSESDHLWAFSHGKRSCVGKSVAIRVIFVIFTSLIHRFKIQAENRVALPNEHSCRFGAIRETLPFRVVLTRR